MTERPTTKPTEPEPPPPWQPDPRWALPVILTGWVWCLAWLPHWAAREHAGFPPALTAIGGCLLALLLVTRARRAWGYGDYLAWIPLAGTVLGLAIGAGAGWWLWRAATGDVFALTPLLLFGGATAGIAWWLLADWAAPRAEIPAGAPAAAVAASLDDERVLMRRMLDAAGMGGIDVLGLEHTRAGQSWQFGPRHVDAEGEPLEHLADFTDFTLHLPRLEQRLALTWRRRGVEFEPGDIRPEPIKVDRWWLHLNTQHVEVQDVPLSSAPPPRPWSMPAWLGLFLDGPDLELSLRARHLKCVGATGMGKGVIANNLIRAAATAASGGRREVMVWVLSTDKLNPLVWPWLTGYLSGRDAVPVLDWVAGQDPAECLRMLSAAYRLSRSRNDELSDESKLATGPDRPALLLIWDEGKHGGLQEDRVTLGGVEYTISRLFATLLGNVRSAGLSMAAFTQDGEFDGLGPFGPEMMRNFTIRVVTTTETFSDGINTLPKLVGTGVDTTLLRDHTVYVQPSTEDPKARAMPAKMAHLDGTALIDQVVAQVAAMPPPRWSESDLAALGEDYALRWHPQRVPTLERACRQRGWDWRPQPPQPSTEGPDMRKQPRREPPPEAQPPQPAGRLATPDELDALDDLAARMMREADAAVAARDAEGGADPGPGGDVEAAEAAVATVTVEPLREPMASVAAYLDELPPEVEWVPTALLAERAWGSADNHYITALGRVIAAQCPGLRATDPRPYPGGRGRGFVVAELAAAVARLRHHD